MTKLNDSKHLFESAYNEFQAYTTKVREQLDKEKKQIESKRQRMLDEVQRERDFMLKEI